MAKDTEINQLPSAGPILSDVLPYSKGDTQTFKTSFQDLKTLFNTGTITGPTGYTGPGNFTGYTGYTGPSSTGPTGPSGASIVGSTGPTGATGYTGYTGGFAPNVAAKAISTGDQAPIPTPNGYAKVELKATTFDTQGNMHDDVTDNSRIVASVAGYYVVQGQVYANGYTASADSEIEIYLVVNGGPFAAISRSKKAVQTGGLIANVQSLVFLNIGDYVELSLYNQTSIGIVPNPDDTWLSIIKI